MSFLIGTLCFVLLSVSLFLILLVLIQRGRGGGLAGAFGGMGGQSAFGTRAGDTFTRITIVLAVIWVLLAGGIGMLMRRDAEASKIGANSPFIPGKESDAKEEDDDTKEEAKSDSGNAVDFGINQEGEKSKAVGTSLPDEMKTDDAAPKAESEATEQTTPAEKAADPAEDATTPDAKTTGDDGAIEKKASTEEPAEPEAPKEVSDDPEASGPAPPSGDPNP